jgi:cell division protein FtsQ
VGGTKYLYDPAGVRVGIANGSENLPLINIDGAPEKSKQFKSAIDVLMALPADLLERVSEIDAKSKDDVTLRLRGYAGQRIIWGDGSDSVLKSKVLDALILNQKKSDRVTFDVSSPSAPVVRYGNF